MKREYRQEGYRVATVLPLSSDTSRFLQDVDNKADFLRMVLNDLMEAYPYPYEYTELSEEERLERFFGVKKPRERVIQELTKKLEIWQMIKKDSALKLSMSDFTSDL